MERGEPLTSKTQVFAPDLVEEIREIAEGAGRAFMDGNLDFSRNQEGYGNFFHNFGELISHMTYFPQFSGLLKHAPKVSKILFK